MIIFSGALMYHKNLPCQKFFWWPMLGLRNVTDSPILCAMPTKPARKKSAPLSCALNPPKAYHHFRPQLFRGEYPDY
jgi:hypothetical protein